VFVDGRFLKNKIFEPIIMISSDIIKDRIFKSLVFYIRLILALKLQMSISVAKIQIKVVLLRLNIKPINIDEEKI
jgi:hypothetical protein